MIRRTLAIGTLLGTIAGMACAQDSITRYLEAPPEEKPCIMSTAEIYSDFWTLQIGLDGRRMILHELSSDPVPLESTSQRLDIEGLVSQESDPSGIIETTVQVYAQEWKHLDYLEQGFALASQFYLQKANVALHFSFPCETPSLELLEKPSEGYSLVLASEAQWHDFCTEIERKTDLLQGRRRESEDLREDCKYVSGIAWPAGKIAIANTSEILDPLKMMWVEGRGYLPPEEAIPISLGQVVGHELGHTFGLWHAGDVHGGLVPSAVLTGKIGDEEEIPNLMGMLDEYSPLVGSIGMDLTPLQAQVVRSSLRGGVAAKEATNYWSYVLRIMHYAEDTGHVSNESWTSYHVP